MQTFKPGDRVFHKTTCDGGTPEHVEGVVEVSQYTEKLQVKSSSFTCSHLDTWELISQAQQNMSSLVTLTKEQKAGLSKDDQALVRLGLVGADLQPTSLGKEYHANLNFNKDRKLIAAEAAKDIAEIEEAAKQETK